MLQYLLRSTIIRYDTHYHQLLKANPVIARLQLHQNIQSSDESQLRVKKKKENPKHTKLVCQIASLLNCTENKADDLIKQNKLLWKSSETKITRNIEFLVDNKISTISENSWILGMPIDELKAKLEIIKEMEPQDINDFLPLISSSLQQLDRAKKTLLRDNKLNAEGNRIYFFSKRLKVKPAIVCHHFSTHMFIFTISFKKLKENLDLMLEGGITPMNVLNDLWVFIRASSNMKARLTLCEKAGKGNLKPWVISCTDETLEKSLTMTEDRKSLLGDGTVITYLSQRLGYNEELTKAIVTRYKAVTKVRVAKLKSVLDYLLIEEKFEPSEVACAIRILCLSLETTKKRIKELRERGCRPTSLIYVCLSQADYKKFAEKWS